MKLPTREQLKVLEEAGRFEGWFSVEDIGDKLRRMSSKVVYGQMVRLYEEGWLESEWRDREEPEYGKARRYWKVKGRGKVLLEALKMM